MQLNVPLKQRRTTATCTFSGHMVKSNGFREDWYDEYQFKPGSRDTVRRYLSGDYLFCERNGCSWQHLAKAKLVKVVIRNHADGTEEDITAEFLKQGGGAA